MNSKIEELRIQLQKEKIDWNDLFDAKFKSKTFTPPLYFGVYRVIYKAGYVNAEANYKARLKKLITHLDNLQLTSPIAIRSLEKIKAFQESLGSVNFRSEAFKASCRLSLLKHIRRLTKTKSVVKRNNVQEFETLVDTKEFKSINTFCHQLSPFNYSYSHLTHFFFISDTEIKTLLVDDSKRKSTRRINGIFELTSYISTLEVPRRKFKRALSYRYLMMEGNPGLNSKESVIFGGGSFDTSAGGGVLESWMLRDGVWKYKETINHWRR